MRQVTALFTKLLLVTILLLSSHPVTAGDTSLDEGLSEISRQVSESMPSGKKTTIAVMDFNDLQGNVTLLGRFISEELITRFFQTKHLEVIERSLLDKAIQELKFNTSDLVDTSNAKQLGRVVGADAIMVGTLTDLGQSIKINARVIVVESGKVIGAASALIVKDTSIEEMQKRVKIGSYSTPGKTVRSQEKSFGGMEGYSEKSDGKLLYYDDFKKNNQRNYKFSAYKGDDGIDYDKWTMAKYKVNPEAGHLQIIGADDSGIEIGFNLDRSINAGRVEIDFLPTRYFPNTGEIRVKAISHFSNGYFTIYTGSSIYPLSIGKILSGESIVAEERNDFEMGMNIKHKLSIEFNSNDIIVYWDNKEIFSIPNGENFGIDEIKIGFAQLSVFLNKIKVEEL